MVFKVQQKLTIALVIVLLASIPLVSKTLGADDYIDIADSYAVDEIEALSDEGIITGDPEGTFRPSDSINRAEFAAVITRALELDELPEKGTGFEDVHERDWYAGYVGALVDAGITTGTTETTFSPDDPVTREELAVFFVRAFDLEEDAKKLTDKPNINDLDQVSSWAKDYVALDPALNEGGVVTNLSRN
ncbi:S-layer homology domain-containing protein [Natranaerobius thermophilus]|uniref:S-layer domain protein n=1 Tax=Natranaerobius thermophilus (strain ATCC BAA-1301 / DSM 18059 / JW/NM-WN-LF) TaxID=457570 RepID=B2A2E1_NATTJ|nr:S-layer homology domain-containing protein [Natranaerobius thermophilus]ACB86247.1 S-layer domain protein [Natranaerobius thermophilus JW/NM-WN-LF]